MNIITGLIAAVLLASGLLFLDAPEVAAAYAIGTLLALLCFVPWKSKIIYIFFASVSAVLMFYLYAQFFDASHRVFETREASFGDIQRYCLLVGGFAMMVVLSEYSCLMKGRSNQDRKSDAL